MFHILGDCYLQKKPDILVFRPSSQNVEKLQFINYFLFRMEINRRHTSWLHVTCLGTASRTEEFWIFYSALLQMARTGVLMLSSCSFMAKPVPSQSTQAKCWWLVSKLWDAHSPSAEVMFRLIRGWGGISSPALEIPNLNAAAVSGLYPDHRQELRYHKLQAHLRSHNAPVRLCTDTDLF